MGHQMYITSNDPQWYLLDMLLKGDCVNVVLCCTGCDKSPGYMDDSP